MWSYDQAVNLLGCWIGDGKSGPVTRCVRIRIGLHLNTTHNTIRTGGRGNLYTLTLIAQQFNSARKIKGGVLFRDFYRFNGKGVNCRKDRNGNKRGHNQREKTREG